MAQPWLKYQQQPQQPQGRQPWLKYQQAPEQIQQPRREPLLPTPEGDPNELVQEFPSFGRNVARGVGRMAKGVQDIATLGPVRRAGGAIGTDIAKTLKEQRSVIDPARPYKELAKKATYPIRHPLEYLKEGVVDPAKEISAAVVADPVERIKHPIKSLYEEPVETILTFLPLAPKGLKAVKGLGKAARGVVKSPAVLQRQAGQIYRKVLRPRKGVIQKIEIRGHKNLDDIYDLAAKERLPVKSVEGTINTIEAQGKLGEKIGNIQADLNKQLLKSKATFNLEEIAAKVKSELKGRIKNASELAKAEANVDDLIAAEITRSGTPVVGAQEFNRIKQGMWSVGYDMMNPTANSTSRQIGHVMREALEAGVKDAPVRNLNALSGRYSDLRGVLINAHGNIVPGGRLGNMLAQGAGGVTGAIAGSVSPFPVGGALAGGAVGRVGGKKIAEYLASPERLTRKAAGLTKKAASRSLNIKRIDDLKKRFPALSGSVKKKLGSQSGEVFPKEAQSGDVNWTKVNTYLKRKGYDVRGADDVKQLYGKMTNNFTEAPTGDHLDAIKFASTKKIMPESTKIARHFGYTNDTDLAGYLTPEGKLLDFSGRKQGNTGATLRAMDHREINSILDYNTPALKKLAAENPGSNSTGMRYFMNKGNIRMQKGGVDLSIKPTDKQYKIIREHINKNRGESYFVDLSDESGRVVKSLAYEYPKVNTATILDDITDYWNKAKNKFPKLSGE